jgi:ketosteroid isomerase-like protein
MTLTLSLVLLAASLSAQGEKPAVDPREEVFAAERAFARTMADRDHAAFVSFLSPDTIFLSPAAVYRGREEVAEAWRRLYEGPEAPFSWAPERVEVIDSGSLAVSTGPVMDPSGKRTGTYVSTWRRGDDGSWKIVLDTGCGCGEP